MSDYGDLKIHMPMRSINVTPLNSVCFVQSPLKKCAVHSSLLKKPSLTWHIWKCCNRDISHSCKTYRRSYSSKTKVPPTSTVRFVSTWTQCYQDVGQGVRLEMTNHWCYGPRGPLILRPVIFSLGICQRPGIRHNFATWPRWPIGTDHCRSEKYRRTHVDTCGKNLNIVSMCAVSPVGAQIEHLYLSKKIFSVFLLLWTIPLR